MKDDNLSQALSVMKKYSGADELTQEMVQELIEKVYCHGSRACGDYLEVQG